MITVTSAAELPSTVPNHLKRLAGRTEAALGMSFEKFAWNSLPGIFFCYGHIDKTKKVHASATPMTPGVREGAERTVDLLNAMAVRGVPLVEGCRYHLGYGMMSEGLNVDDEEARKLIIATRNGEQMTELIHDLSATGKVLHWRMGLGVLVSGWTYQVARYRNREGLEVTAYPPGEHPEGHEVYEILRDFNTRVPLGKIKGRGKAR